MILRTLRKTVKPFIWILIVALVISIGFTYGYGRLSQKKIEPIAKVNGVPISYTEFAQAYTNVQKNYEQNGGKISPQIEKYLKEEVLNQLIINELLWQETKRAKIKVNEKEVKEMIKNIMVNLGIPSGEAFLRFLTYQHISYPQLEEEIKKEIAINKLKDGVQNSIEITDKEIEDRWLKENERVEVEYLLISPGKYEKDVKIEPKDIENYYKEFKQDFTVPEKVKLNYILLKPEEFKNKVVISEQMLKDYYGEHLDSYLVPEKRRVSHILIRFPSSEMSEEEKKEAKKRIEEVQKKLKEGGDFADLCKKYSEDTSTRDKGGDLGFFTEQELASSSFVKSVFSLKKVGDISDIVETPLGYHLIKLTEIKLAYTRSFEEVKKQIKEELTGEKSWDLAKREGEEIKKEINSQYISFEEYTEKHPEVSKTTPFFARNDKIEELGGSTNFNQIAFSLKKGETSPLLKLSSGYCLLKLKERKPSYISPLKDVKEKIEKKLTQEKAETLAEEKAKEIRKKIKENTNLSSLAKEIGIEYKELGYLKRSDWIEGIYQEDKEKFIRVAFSLKKNEVSEPLLLTNGYYLIKLLNRDSSLEEFSKQKEKLTDEMLSQKKAEIFNAWIENLKEKAKIIDNSSLFLSS